MTMEHARRTIEIRHLPGDRLVKWLPLDDGYYLLASVMTSTRAAPVFVTQKALLQVEAHQLRAVGEQACGILFGAPCVDPASGLEFILIDAAAPAIQTATINNAAAALAADLSRVIAQAERAGRRIMGWYRCDVPLGQLISVQNVGLHRSLFSQPWQVSLFRDGVMGQGRGALVRVEPNEGRAFSIPFVEISAHRRHHGNAPLLTSIGWLNYRAESEIALLPDEAFLDGYEFPPEEPVNVEEPRRTGLLAGLFAHRPVSVTPRRTTPVGPLPPPPAAVPPMSPVTPVLPAMPMASLSPAAPAESETPTSPAGSGTPAAPPSLASPVAPTAPASPVAPARRVSLERESREAAPPPNAARRKPPRPTPLPDVAHDIASPSPPPTAESLQQAPRPAERPHSPLPTAPASPASPASPPSPASPTAPTAPTAVGNPVAASAPAEATDHDWPERSIPVFDEGTEHERAEALDELLAELQRRVRVDGPRTARPSMAPAVPGRGRAMMFVLGVAAVIIAGFFAVRGISGSYSARDGAAAGELDPGQFGRRTAGGVAAGTRSVAGALTPDQLAQARSALAIMGASTDSLQSHLASLDTTLAGARAASRRATACARADSLGVQARADSARIGSSQQQLSQLMGPAPMDRVEALFAQMKQAASTLQSRCGS